MNAAGPSNQTISVNEAVNPAELLPPPAPAVPLAVHPLVWAIQLWIIASVVSLVLSVGLSQALRGAFVGAENWIIRVDHSAALTSQVAAICTTLLLIYMGLLSARASRSLLLGVMATLLGTAPTIIVFYAHRIALPQAHNWISALCASVALIICATQARTKTTIRVIVALGGLSLLGAALRAGGLNGTGSPLYTQIGAMLEGFFAWTTLAVALGWHLWKIRSQPLRGALLLGVAALLWATVRASTEPQIAEWILLTGRSLAELSPLRVMGPLAPLAFSAALTLVLSTLFSRPGSLGQLICGIFSLAVVAPASPLVIAWLTLCGYCCVVICWVPDDPLDSSSL